MSTDTSPQDNTAPIIIDGISYIPSSALATGIPKISFKDGHAFAVVDLQGEATRLYSTSGSELGFYYKDTRYLGIWEMTFNQASPIALSHELRNGGSTVVFSMTNRDLKEMNGNGRICRDTFLFRRILTFYKDTLYETVEIKNFASVTHDLQVEQWIGGRFDDVFEVRGFNRTKRGRVLAAEEESIDGSRVTVLQYEGLDSQIMKTYVYRLFEAEKLRVSPSLVGYFTRVRVPAKGTVLLKTVVSFDHKIDLNFCGESYRDLTIADKMRLLYEQTANQGGLTSASALKIESDNAIVNRSIRNALTDIFMLLTDERGKLLYPYAGVPWFSAPFGRDGIITAYQLLPWFPAIARGVLDFVFQNLGTNEDPFTDEQYGKVFHEFRMGEMARTKEVPFIPYYGSVDATPLALILLHEYIRWTLDREKLNEWWPQAMKALSWIQSWTDQQGVGFISYARKSPTGLVNQGWKDSHDSVMHATGELAQPPISLCEVQAYSYRARMGMASLAKWQGNELLSQTLRREALELRARFNEQFWDSSGQFIYLALDGDQKPCAVRTSNMGHCLWSQIATTDQGRRVSELLMSDAMFSGHGIRTLSDEEYAYNPMSYHNGSVWPHENSMILEGFRFYGHLPELEKLSLGLLGVFETSQDFRMPELFCGFRKRGIEPPIPYEVACKPQAWAAGSIFLMLKAMLGLSIDLDQNYLVCHSPLLTSKINTLEISQFRVRDSEMKIRFQRTAFETRVESSRNRGGLRVLTMRG